VRDGLVIVHEADRQLMIDTNAKLTTDFEVGSNEVGNESACQLLLEKDKAV
jgi:hypothetical protein